MMEGHEVADGFPGDLSSLEEVVEIYHQPSLRDDALPHHVEHYSEYVQYFLGYGGWLARFHLG